MKPRTQAHSRPRLTLGLSALGLALLALASLWGLQAAPNHQPVQLSAEPVARPVLPSQTDNSSGASASTDADALRNWLQDESVLWGTEMDGGWGLAANGAIQPSLDLRRRFDYLLQLQGQRPLAQITDFLRQLAGQQLSASNAETVMRVWQHYLQLQQTRFSKSVNPRDLSSLAPALAEQQEARRRILGPAWAHAFYGAEEAQTAALILAAADPSQPPSPTPALIDRSSLDAAALARLQEEDEAQARWQSRLASAAAQIQAMRQDRQLSEIQRQQAIQSLLEQGFEGSEYVRASALLLRPSAPP